LTALTKGHGDEEAATLVAAFRAEVKAERRLVRRGHVLHPDARAALSPHVLEHSYRTYLFGLVPASIDTVHVDEELASSRRCCVTSSSSTRPRPVLCRGRR
jgi:hypothetical protein